ncbi:MAG: DUF493 domain-containing protein [Legionellales bacterium]|nr:DUF493 domain-containing protein [Legionellales bacterium]
MQKKTLITFPCEFPLKIIGKASPNFFADITAIIRLHFPLTPDTAIRSTLSEKENYQSISAVVLAVDQPGLDALYQDLSRHPDIQMVL